MPAPSRDRRHAAGAPLALLTAVLALGFLAPGAGADWKVEGRGFGHGVGLSQYGAFGFAEQGWRYRKILAHYYTGTEMAKAGGDQIRVLLGTGGAEVSFSGAANACNEAIDPEREYSFTAEGAGVALRNPDGGRIKGCGEEGATSGRGGVEIGGFGRYRGGLIVHNDDGELLVINTVGIEDYIRGVVAEEVPASWPAQALRAQAVVARSYGLATRRSGPFDHYDDTRSQVYGGREAETRATNRAVKQTKREVVAYDGATAITYFFSTSGGQTESSEYGFSGGNAIPYLKSVEDPYDDASPHHRWTVGFSDAEMESELGGLFDGELREIEILERGRSPRIVRARVVGSAGSTIVTGDTLRARLGLRSTWAKFKHG